MSKTTKSAKQARSAQAKKSGPGKPARKKKWDFSDIATWGPTRHEPGAVIPESGTAEQYETGGWRTERPVRDIEKCNDCMICYWACPDSSIVVKEGKLVGIDLKHCKGCGICAEVCPREAIEMANEIQARKEEEAVASKEEKK